jgi:hypothetical protein
MGRIPYRYRNVIIGRGQALMRSPLNRAATGGCPYPLGHISILNWYHLIVRDDGLDRVTLKLHPKNSCKSS